MPSTAKSSLPRKKSRAAPPASAVGWTFLTNHAHVLISLADNPELRLREVAATVGITERAVQKIIAELEAGGVISRERDGRRNRYEIHRRMPLRHPVEAHREVGHILEAILAGKQAGVTSTVKKAPGG